ncbi:MAG: 3-hydroxyacyl-CoA dehydrogenase family protein [Bryobacteraceae bacterium]
MRSIAVIGAGMMGPGIAQVFASGGHSVKVYNRTSTRLESVKSRVLTNLTLMAEYGLVKAADIPAILDRITTTTDLQDACNGANFVVETVSENLELKQSLFEQIDRLCPPETILCSNTSVISITQIGMKAQRRERIVGTHFYQPPFLVPLVEVVRTEFALPEHIESVMKLLLAAGKVPIRVRKDVTGFVANRMQHALWREAFALIDEGVCDAETVDVAVRNSFGLRLPVLGPVANADLVGLDLTISIHKYVLPHLDVSKEPSSTLAAHVDNGELGFKTKSGFLEWTEESMAQTRNELTTYLLRTISQQRGTKREE